LNKKQKNHSVSTATADIAKSHYGVLKFAPKIHNINIEHVIVSYVIFL